MLTPLIALFRVSSSMTAPSSAVGIAIIGMSCRVPSAADLDTFWSNIRDGVDSITRFEPAELEVGSVSAAEIESAGYVCARGLMADVDQFDAAFFGYLPRDAELMDPQQRIFLELCWQAMEHAGHDVQRLPGRTGVFAGSFLNSYLLANLCARPEFLAEMVDRFQSGGSPVELGNDKDYLATRVAFKLGLRGPAMAIQCACSTSLVAVAMACDSIRSGHCEVALAGGVTIVQPQKRGYRYREGGMASPDGRCRSFDADGAGTVFSNGAGVVVLRRLDDALADGDTIHAVIRGFGINNDGSRKASFTAPTVEGQAEVITDALTMSGFSARSIGYVEAHGTATPLGDPIEIAGLTAAFRAGAAHGPGTTDTGYCALGSVKANIGHLDVAAGVAGLIKAALVVHHGVIPPLAHFRQPNPRIDLAASPFYVPTTATEWSVVDGPRRAAVSAMGVGGTNAHVQLESWPAGRREGLASQTRSQSEEAEAEAEVQGAGGARRSAEVLLILSARSEAALAAASERLAQHLSGHLARQSTLEARPVLPDHSLADVAFTLQMGRRQFDRRRIVVAADPATAVARLRAPAVPGSARTVAANRAQVVFLFPGQGSQYPGMGRDLYDSEPLFRETIDHCAEALLADPASRLDPRTWLLAAADRTAAAESHPGGGPSPSPGRGPSPSPGGVPRPSPGGGRDLADEMMQTVVAQPTLFAFEIALARLVRSWGIHPVAVVGHSVGELAAVTLAGLLDIGAAARFVAARGRLMQAMPPGRMAVVRADASRLVGRLPEGVGLAAINAPGLSVVSGRFDPVDAFLAALEREGIASSALKTSHAFHSPMMAPAARDLLDRFPTAACGPMAIDVASTSLGRLVDGALYATPAYWAEQMLNPVRFAEALVAVAGNGRRVFVEIGPRQTLSVLASEALADAGCLGVEALQQPSEAGPSGREQLLSAVGRLWMTGVSIDWPALQHGLRRRVALPTYPFERKRAWVERPTATPARADAPSPPDARPVHEAIAALAGASSTVGGGVAEIIGAQLALMRAQLHLLGYSDEGPDRGLDESGALTGQGERTAGRQP